MYALVVDDSEINRKYMKILLNNLGINSETAESGEKAIQLCNEKNFDIVFMDIQMPPGIDGLEATKKIKEINLHFIVVAVTTHYFDDIKERFYEVGMDGYIPKPINIESLKEYLEKIIN
jgi:CheY-like chemotaxis protein